MKIRRAIQADLVAIVDIYNQAIREKKSTADLSEFSVAQKQEWFDEHQCEKYPLYVVEVDCKVVAYAYLSAYRPGREALDRTAELSYYVDYNYHSRGYATKLIKTLLEHAKTVKIEVLICILFAINIPSVKLLEKLNFSKWGYIPNAARIGETLIDNYYYGIEISN